MSTATPTTIPATPAAAPAKPKLSEGATAQFDEWSKHKSGELLGNLVYLRLDMIRHEAGIDSRGTPSVVGSHTLKEKDDETTSTDLIASICAVGIIHPIVVAKDKLGWYRISGGRRQEALTSLLGEKAIVACVYLQGSRKEVLYASGAANVGVHRLNTPDLADYLYRVQKDTKDTQEVIAASLGFSLGHVSNLIRVRAEMSNEDVAKWRQDPKTLLIPDALFRVKLARANGGKEKVDFWGTAMGEAAPQTDEQKKAVALQRKRVKLVDDAMASVAKEGVVLGGGLTAQQWELIETGYKLARGEVTNIEIETTSSGKVVAAKKVVAAS